ncbi:MAG: PH domain-containing protein [Aequorivita antarctica]
MENIKKFLNENQNPIAVQKIHNRVSELLTKNEVIEYIAVQKKPAINISPECIALTNKRIIFCRPKTFGLSMQFDDFLWKEISDCHMKEGIMGATFFVKTIRNRVVSLDYLPKSQARLLYRYAQEREEEMSEFRRQRELENARAAAGGGIIVNTGASNDTSKNGISDNALENLKNLKVLLENNLITQEDFDTKKTEILNKL